MLTGGEEEIALQHYVVTKTKCKTGTTVKGYFTIGQYFGQRNWPSSGPELYQLFSLGFALALKKANSFVSRNIGL